MEQLTETRMTLAAACRKLEYVSLVCPAAEVNSNIRLALEEIHRAKEKLNKYTN